MPSDSLPVQSQSTINRINELRQASLSRELSLEEMKEAIRLMRGDRITAGRVSAKSRAAKAPVNTEDLLSKLGDF